MSSRELDQASQGVIADLRSLGRATPRPNPDGRRIIADIGAAVNRKDAADHKPRPAQPLPDRQDWRRG